MIDNNRLESQIETSVKAAAGEFPLAVAVIEDALRLSPTLIRSQLAYMIQNRSPGFWYRAEELIRLAKAIGGSPAESLIEYTLVYLKEQLRFLSSGQYSHDNFEDARKQVYDNPDVMEKFYLEGLMLTHAFWPIHFDIHDFFRGEFLPRVPDSGVGAEFGFGHGLYLLEVLNANAGTYALGYDISEFSRAYADKLLRHGGVPEDRYRLGAADVRDPLPANDGEYEWVIFAEVLEHIPDPLSSLRELRRCARRGGPIFVTTVVNSNALDHMWLFTSVEEVEQMLREAGVRIVASRTFAVDDYVSGNNDPTIDVACVCHVEP